MNKEQLLNKAEYFADLILRRGKHVLPHVARLLIVSTFIEDGLRMWFQWDNQSNYMVKLWEFHHSIGILFVLLNMILQLVGPALVLARKYTNVAIGTLAFIVVFQSIAYNLYTMPQYLMRNIALLGGLILLLAESKSEGKSLFAGLPSVGNSQGKTYMQLGGRVFVIIMSLTLVKLDWSLESIVINVIGVVFALLILIGYKTKFSALLLVILLACFNFYSNNWWNIPVFKSARDHKKYNFFQILSIQGGLLLLVTLGPGGYSIDEHKKSW